jgi:hypothetical protein
MRLPCRPTGSSNFMPSFLVPGAFAPTRYLSPKRSDGDGGPNAADPIRTPLIQIGVKRRESGDRDTLHLNLPGRVGETTDD